MATVDQLAAAVLEGDGLAARSAAQDLLQQSPLASVSRPMTDDPRVLAVAAALLELLAERTQQAPPAWAEGVGPAPETIYLLTSAQTMRHLRDLCERESPEPLRKRRLFAPSNYLSFA